LKKYVGFEVHIPVSYEDLHLLGYNTVQSIESQLMFQRNMSPPSMKKAVSRVHMLDACFTLVFLLDSHFNPEDGSDMPPKRQLTYYMALYTRKHNTAVLNINP
jgi:hypothetical protein